MTDIPTSAPRSEDGQWWWDGSQWQPVGAQAGGAATATEAQPGQGAATAASSEAVGQLSEDGQWQWDGTQWQPAQAAAGTPAAAAGASGGAAGTPAAAAGASGAAAGTPTAAAAPAAAASATTEGPRITLGVPTAEPRTAHDGTTEVMVGYSATNTGTTAIAAGTLETGFYVVTAGGAAESSAYVTGDVLAAIAVGEEHHGSAPIQLDPGSWTIWVVVTDKATNETLATSQDVTAEVAGQRATARSFDDTQSYTLTVQITQVEHVEGNLFRVHYDIQTDREVPAGLTVTGRLEGSGIDTGQIYQLTTGIGAGQHHAHYLTLEATMPSHLTATIMADPGGPSEKSASVQVDIAEDGTPTTSG
jgi:hypothetical protein